MQTGANGEIFHPRNVVTEYYSGQACQILKTKLNVNYE